MKVLRFLRSLPMIRRCPTQTERRASVAKAASLWLAVLSTACACTRAGEPSAIQSAPHADTSHASGPQSSATPTRQASDGAEANATAPNPAPGPASSSVCDPPARAQDDGLAFSKVRDEPVSSLGLGRGGRAAILSGNRAHLFDGERWLPLEPPLPAGTLQIFFGRDNEPRIMGFSPRESGEPAQVYLRCRNQRCLPAPDEIGKLASARGALYGVLGFDDPEVVCRVGQICLIKRLSGWKSVPAHAEPAPVLLSGGTAFALHSDRVERVGDAGFVELEPARVFHEPRGVARQPDGVIWVIDRAGDALARLVAGTWQEQPSPLRSARALWARTNEDVWLVAESGAAHFDGERWSCVAAAPGPLEFVLGNDEQVWLAGRAGAFRGERVRSLRNQN